MQWTFYIHLIYLSISLIACQVTEEEQIKPLDYKSILLSGADSLPLIQYPFHLNNDSAFLYFQKYFDYELCDSITPFKLAIKNFELKVFINRDCPTHIINCKRMIPTIKMNMHKDLLLNNHQIIPQDSLSYWIKNDFWHFFYMDEIDYEKNPKLKLRWDTSNDKKSIEKFFNDIINGYLMLYTEMAEDLFHKELSELSLEELNTLKHKLPFILELGNLTYVPPPPPPPPPPLKNQ